MSASYNAPVGRAPGDVSQAAFGAASNASRRDVRAPGAPARQPFTPARQPFSSHLELGPLLRAASNARVHTRLVLQEWGLGAHSETLELLVSELTANSLVASQALQQPVPSPIHLWLRAERGRVQVMVWDANPRPPIPKQAGEDAESGRGLMIVEALSTRWGWYTPKGIGGKCVWCELVY